MKAVLSKLTTRLEAITRNNWILAAFTALLLLVGLGAQVGGSAPCPSPDSAYTCTPIDSDPDKFTAMIDALINHVDLSDPDCYRMAYRARSALFHSQWTYSSNWPYAGAHDDEWDSRQIGRGGAGSHYNIGVDDYALGFTNEAYRRDLGVTALHETWHHYDDSGLTGQAAEDAAEAAAIRCTF